MMPGGHLHDTLARKTASTVSSKSIITGMTMDNINGFALLPEPCDRAAAIYQQQSGSVIESKIVNRCIR